MDDDFLFSQQQQQQRQQQQQQQIAFGKSICIGQKTWGKMFKHDWTFSICCFLQMGVETKQQLHSLKLTFSPLKLDGWNTRPSFWGPAYFQGLLLLVSGSVVISQ